MVFNFFCNINYSKFNIRLYSDCSSITFGSYRHTDTLKEHQVKFDLDWIAVGPHFDFDTDTNCWTNCESISRESWSKDWFAELKKYVILILILTDVIY